MKSTGLPASLATIVLCLLLVLTGCTAKAPESPPTETTPSTSPAETTPPTQPSPTSEPESWFDVTQYLGIPSDDCKEPVTDLTGLPTASVRLTVDMAKPLGELDHEMWANFTYHPNYAANTAQTNEPFWELVRQTRIFRFARCDDYFSDGICRGNVEYLRQILPKSELAPYELDGITPRYNPNIEFWGCRIYSEDDSGNPQYNFWFLDNVLDTYVSNGLRPVVQCDYLPDALADGEKIRVYNGGLVNVPKDYNQWRDLIYNTVKHCIERYGIEEVRTWRWTLWEEPDLDTFFIDGRSPSEEAGYYTFSCPEREVPPPPGSMEHFLKMWDYFVDGAKAADGQIKVGGPVIASHDWFRPFLSHCVNETNYATGQTGTPLDFICWHGYGDLEFQMTNTRKKLEIISQFPSLKNLPAVQDEWGQALMKQNETTGQAFLNINVAEIYSSYEAANICQFIGGMVSEPQEFPDIFYRWGVMTRDIGTERYLSISQGEHFVPMPSLNTYILLSKLGEERLELTGSAFGDTVHGLATRTANGVQVLLYNFDETDLQCAGENEEIDLTINGLPPAWSAMKHYQIDKQNSNAWANYPVASPNPPLEQLEEDSRLKIVAQTDELGTKDGQVTFRLTMPSNSVSLIVIGEEAAPPAFTPSQHIARVLQEEAAYKAAGAKLDNGDTAGAKAGFEQLVAASFGAVTDGSSNNPYSLWGQKALFALLDIANQEADFATADEIRGQLLGTTLGDLDRFVLLNERLSYLKAAATPDDEIQAVTAELQSVRSRLEYFANWSDWTLVHGYDD